MNRISFLNRGYAFKGLLAVVHEKINKIWVPNRFDTNQPVQSHKKARSLKFWI